MADPVTVNRSLTIPSTGSDVGTWGVVLNGNSNLLDTMVGGFTSISTTGGTITLSAAQLACGTISVSGVLTSNVVLYFPSVRGWWSIENLTTGNFVVYICGAGAAATQIICAPPGEITDIQINGTIAKYRNLGRIGTYVDIASASPPLWVTSCSIPPYLNCDGSSFNPATYPFLNLVLNSTILPDLRGVTRATLNQGTNRITTAGSGIDGNTRFSIGGVQNFALTQANLPNVSFPVTDPGHGHGYQLPSNNNNVANQNSPSIFSLWGGGIITGNTAPAFTGISVSSGGSAVALNNIQPTTISGITMIRAA